MLNKALDTTIDERNGRWLLLAWLTALGATVGALFIGEIIGQTPCSLCWFQRIFMFPLAVILGIAAFRLDASIRIYALPIAGLGAAVAAFHTLLYFGLVEEALTPCARNGPSCSGEAMAMFAWLPLPLVSLLAFAAIAGFLLKCRPGVYR